MFDLEPCRWTDLKHRDIAKTKKFCVSGHVNFDKKPQIVKPAGNYPYYFLEWSDHVKQYIRLVGLI